MMSCHFWKEIKNKKLLTFWLALETRSEILTFGIKRFCTDELRLGEAKRENNES